MLSCGYERYYEPIRLPLCTSARISALPYIQRYHPSHENSTECIGVSTVPCYPLADVSLPYTPGDQASRSPTLSPPVLPSPVRWWVGISTVSALSGVSPCVLLHEATTSIHPQRIATRQLVSRSALYHPDFLRDHRHCLRGFIQRITPLHAQITSRSRMYRGSYRKEQG